MFWRRGRCFETGSGAEGRKTVSATIPRRQAETRCAEMALFPWRDRLSWIFGQAAMTTMLSVFVPRRCLLEYVVQLEAHHKNSSRTEVHIRRYKRAINIKILNSPAKKATLRFKPMRSSR